MKSLTFKSVALLLLLLTGCATSESRLKKQNEAAAHYKLGIAHLNENRTQEAFIEFQKAVEMDPKNAEVHYALGHIYFQRGKNEEAAREFETVIKIDPEYSAAHNSLGQVYGTDRRWDDAIREFQKALKNPKYDTPHLAHYNLGLVYENKGQHAQAIKEF